MSSWDKIPSSSLFYVVFAVSTILVLKEVNSIVVEPYMDEPFHVPQAQAYCEGRWDVWDPKITTPPGLYLESVLLRGLFVFKCRLPLLRLVPMLHLLAFPPLLASLEAYHQRMYQPRDLLSPSISSIAISLFPLAWFFGFLYYTDIPGAAFILGAFYAQVNESSWLAALLGLCSLFFRQTNIIWVLYIFAFYTIGKLRWTGKQDPQVATVHDPPALEASWNDLWLTAQSLPRLLPRLLLEFIPYGLVCVAFAGFIVWNGGIVLGDKANHVPALHIPQVFYFYASATVFGWPALLFSGSGATAGPFGLAKELYSRLCGTRRRIILSVLSTLLIGLSTYFFTIHHPFILSDNRHYTFYLWKRVLFVHPIVPYLLSPVYLICIYAWWIRAGGEQTMLQTMLLPLSLIPTLLPSPLLEPRYFILPYILLRLQVSHYQTPLVIPPNTKRKKTQQPTEWSAYYPFIEVIWYSAINFATMYVFLYKERVLSGPNGDEVIRFMY